jgi:hypothetical protein
LKRHGDESGVQLACGTAGSNRLMDNLNRPGFDAGFIVEGIAGWDAWV